MELEKPITFRLDTTSSTQYIYYAESQPGAEEDKPVWRMQRYDKNLGSWLFALGDSSFAYRYSERISLQYR